MGFVYKKHWTSLKRNTSGSVHHSITIIFTMMQWHLPLMQCIMINMVLFNNKWRERQAQDLKEESKGEISPYSLHFIYSQRSVPLMLTPPPVHPVVIVAAWFTDIIGIAKSTPPPHAFSSWCWVPLTASIGCFKLSVITYLILIMYWILHHTTLQKGGGAEIIWKQGMCDFFFLLLFLALSTLHPLLIHHVSRCTLCMPTLSVLRQGESLPVTSDCIRNRFSTSTMCGVLWVEQSIIA